MINYDDKVNHIHPHKLLEKMKHETLNIIDIREPYELLALPFKNAQNIPLNAILRFYDELLSKDKTYYIICHHGQRSYYVTEYLQGKGYNVINVLGGIDLVN